MKQKSGYTLAEILVTLATIGLVAIISISILRNIIPNQEEHLFRKSYYQIENIVADLVNNDTLYGRDETYPTNLLSNLKAIQNGNFSIEAGSNTKFCQLFANQLKLKREVKCNEQITNFTENTPAETAFETDNGMQWILPVSYFVSPNIPKKIFIDVNGREGQNCYIQNDITCKTPDRFALLVYPNGKIERDNNPLEAIPEDLEPNHQNNGSGIVDIMPPEIEEEEKNPISLYFDGSRMKIDLSSSLYEYEDENGKYHHPEWADKTGRTSYYRSEGGDCKKALGDALREVANVYILSCQSLKNLKSCTYKEKTIKLKKLLDEQLYSILLEYSKNPMNPEYKELTAQFDKYFDEDIKDFWHSEDFLYGSTKSKLVRILNNDKKGFVYVNKRPVYIRGQYEGQTPEGKEFEPFDTGNHGGRVFMNPALELFVEAHSSRINKELDKLYKPLSNHKK